LDSWPVLEWLLGQQPAAQNFTAFLKRLQPSEWQLMMTRINAGEVDYMLAKKGTQDQRDRGLATFLSLPIEIVSIDDHLVDAATALKRRHACSYADCFAAALAIRFDIPIVTGDKEFLTLREQGIVRVEWLGA
jgi:predicted nucleic acid-binding protein